MKCCSKCGNDKLIKGIRYCLNCGADVEKKCDDKAKCCVKKEENDCNCANNKRVVKSRLSVELFEII